MLSKLLFGNNMVIVMVGDYQNYYLSSRFLSLQRIFATDEITEVCCGHFFFCFWLLKSNWMCKTRPFQPFVSFLRKLMSAEMGRYLLRSMSVCAKPMGSRYSFKFTKTEAHQWILSILNFLPADYKKLKI